MLDGSQDPTRKGFLSKLVPYVLWIVKKERKPQCEFVIFAKRLKRKKEETQEVNSRGTKCFNISFSERNRFLSNGYEDAKPHLVLRASLFSRDPAVLICLPVS